MPRTCSVCLTLSLLLVAPGIRAADLLGAEQVLSRVDQSPSAGKGKSATGQLLQRIRDYRLQAGKLPPSEAAAQWFVLYDEAGHIGGAAALSDFAAYDADTLRPVGVASMLAALPPPAAWPALREEASKRAEARPNDPQTLTVRLMMEVLARDRVAATATLNAIEVAAANLDANARSLVADQLSSERGWLATLYGSRDEVAKSFVARAKEGAQQPTQAVYRTIAIPDLVGLVGETQAAALLTEVLRLPVVLRSNDGDATRALVHRLALQQVQSLARAQWGLVDTPEALPLYEALQNRFESARIDPLANESPDKRRADVMYLIGLIVAGRQNDAERQLELVTRTVELDLPKPVVATLHRTGKTEALFRFLHNLLQHQPQLKVWNIYLQESAYAGHSKETLDLIDGLITRPDLPDYLARDLRFRRIAALLASDQTEPALEQMRAMLDAAPSASDPALNSLANLGLQAAALGRLLDRNELSAQGLAFTVKILSLEGTTELDREEIITGIYAEMRKEGKASEAESVVVAELRRAHGQASAFSALASGQFTGERAALTELAGIYDTAHRPGDVLTLLDGASGWGASDLVETLDSKDSFGAPLGLAAARALTARGDKAKAIVVVRALLDRMPAYDPAYELFVELAGNDAVAELDQRYARDRFEERPLIWKAVVLNKTGHVLEAEAAAKSAIAIDPSDGKEGPGDRLRAYAVLASILEGKGDLATANVYRGAVQAIRLSEQGDELYKFGLYQRALKRYDEALAQFADAYCIQSRLAVQMSKVGLNSQALAHYRRAYELMPQSFGRVESHCFGCESVFEEPTARSIAEQVFTTLVEKTPKNPQVHYMLGYLRQEQGKYAEALESYRIAIRLDSEYLNAWRHLQELASHTYIEPEDRDVAVLKLIELDPEQRHVQYVLNQTTDPRSLWIALDRIKPAPIRADLYPLARSARDQATIMAGLPESAREEMEQYRALTETMSNRTNAKNPRQGIANHVLITSIRPLLGAAPSRYEMAE